MRNLLTVLLLLCATFSIYAQEVQIKGVVISGTDNEPLPGVNVVVKGTTNGTMTDIDGQFVLFAPEGETLSISYIGFKPTEVKAESSRALTILLHEDTEVLDEVVVIGYGVQKKSVVTAAISRVTAEDLNNTTPSRIEDALKGKVSGVQITQSSGQPGAESKVRIRGVGTVNDSNPLYIVDGMAVDGGISYLNPTDIESVEILKDAASAAIYGARAANGVILVTTKQGKSGKANINYDFTIGWQNPWKHRSVLGAQDYMMIMNEMDRNDGGQPRYTDADMAAIGKGTDWQKETFNSNAPVQSHQVSVNGGTDAVTYFFSFGYFDQEGIVGGNYDKSNYKRYSLRSNTTYNVYEAKDRNFLNKVKVGANMGYSRAVSKDLEVSTEYGSVLGSALAFDPTIPVYAKDPDAVLALYPNAVTDKNGSVFSLPPAGFQEIANPVGMLNQPQSNIKNEDKFVASFWAEVDVYEGLKFRSSYGADLAFWGQDEYAMAYYLTSQGKNNDQSTVRSEMNRGFKWQVENYLTYTKSFEQKHNFTVLVGQSAQKYSTRFLKGWDYDLFSTDPGMANINSGTADREKERVEGGVGPDESSFHSLASYFGRLDYNYDERYIFQATVRRDGSSNFGPKNKWAVFPSVSLGWNVSNEAFMEGRPEWFNTLKIRGSWGKNGNERIKPFRYTSLMQGNQSYYFGSGNNANMIYGMSPSKISNPNVKWEESEQLDLGFETRLFNSLTFGFDYFKKKTNGMLMEQPIPDYAGKDAPYANAGDMENWGLEFELGYRKQFGQVGLNFSANVSYLKNKLINLGNDSGENIYESAGAAGVGSYIKGQNGEVFPFFYGYKTDGILQNQAEVDAYNSKYGENAVVGDVRFVDDNEDGKITDDDKVKIGKGMPDWTFGFTIGADWNNFDLNLFFQGTAGNDIFDLAQRGDVSAMNKPSWILDRWHGEGTSNSIPRVTKDNPNRNWRSSDLYIKNGNYLRLKTIQLGYTLPRQLVRKATIERLRLFVAAENLLTFTKYDGFDPELAAGDNYYMIGVDKGNYPQSRTITVGANLTF